MVSSDLTDQERERARQVLLDSLRNVQTGNRTVETRAAHSYNPARLDELIQVLQQNQASTTTKLIVDVDYFPGTEHPAMRRFVQFLATSPTVTSVHLRDLCEFDPGELDDGDFQAYMGPAIDKSRCFLAALATASALQELHLQGLLLSNLKNEIKRVLQQNQTITHITINTDHFLKQEELLTLLCRSTTLRAISLSGTLQYWHDYKKAKQEFVVRNGRRIWVGGGFGNGPMGEWKTDPTGGTVLEVMMHALASGREQALQEFVWTNHGLNHEAVERLTTALTLVPKVSIQDPLSAPDNAEQKLDDEHDSTYFI